MQPSDLRLWTSLPPQWDRTGNRKPVAANLGPQMLDLDPASRVCRLPSPIS